MNDAKNSPSRLIFPLVSFVILTILGMVDFLLIKIDFFNSFDRLAMVFLQANQSSLFLEFNKIISLFEVAIFVFVIPLMGYLIFRRKFKEAIFIFLGSQSWFIMRLLKAVFDLSCPRAPKVVPLYTFNSINSLLGDSRFTDTKMCFPSGHVFVYLSVWGMVIFLRKKIWKSLFWQRLISFFAIFLILLIGESRIYLGAHWFSDVLGGYLFGGAWLMLLVFLYKLR